MYQESAWYLFDTATNTTLTNFVPLAPGVYLTNHTLIIL